MRGLPLVLLLVTAGASLAQTKQNPQDGLTYVWIPPGAYQMGCSSGDIECFAWEPSAHEVVIPQGFWIARTEVTQRAYRAVVGLSPSLYEGLDLPVERVGWRDAARYCEAVGMRLPTEVEWEYASRGGSREPRYAPLDSIAWHDGNSQDQTHAAAQKRPNAFGLYDTLGNVWEWVQDAYAQDTAKRLLRGGSFHNPDRELRVSNRLWALPDTRHRNIGFRCAGD